MQINPDDLQPHEFYRYLVQVITPRPIAWVSTVSPGGVSNIAPFSFFNGVGANPPSVVFSPVNNRKGEKKDTLKNIEANGQFVVNVVSHTLAHQMNQSAYEYGYEVSEFEAAGIETLLSERIAPPRVAQSPVAMECETLQIINVGEGPLGANLVIGRIVMMHLADGVCSDQGVVDPAKLDTIGRMGGSDYSTTRDRFEMPRPTSP
ncbi:MAG: flavin reductase family protein [Phycisphaerales bacterium JB063]